MVLENAPTPPHRYDPQMLQVCADSVTREIFVYKEISKKYLSNFFLNVLT